MLAELGELSGLVAAGSRYASLRTPLRALGELHAAHIEALDGERTVGDAPAVAFAGPADALRRVRAREQQGQRRLAGWAVAAESGALARLLASMSAGVAQHLVVLPATVRCGPVTTLAAMQRTLAAEHAAVYVYGALGAQTSRLGHPRAVRGDLGGVRRSPRPT